MNKLELPDDDPVGTLRHTVAKARFEHCVLKPGEVPITHQSKEVDFPVTHHYLDSMLAEHVATSLKSVFEELFDSLETQVLEISGTVPVEYSDNWKNGPDAIAELWLKYATGKEYKEMLGRTDHPPEEEAFGKTPIMISVTAAIVRAPEFNYVQYAAIVNSFQQSEEDKLSYSKSKYLETIY